MSENPGPPWGHPPYGQPQRPGQPGQYGGPPGAPYGYYHPQPATDGTAIAALACAIASFFVCPVVPAIVALALASNARDTIAASRGAKTGEDLVRAARIIAWVNILLAVVALVAVVSVFSVGGVVVSHS
jgi:hypothetical protein